MLISILTKHVSRFHRSKSWNFAFSRSVLQSIKEVKLKDAPKLYKKAFTVGTLFVGGSAVFANFDKNLLKSFKIPTVAYCDDLLVRPIIETADASKQPTEPFDWYKFWSILKPQMIFFIGAVASALVVAFLNIQIPSLLGDLVTVVGRLGLKDNTQVLLEELRAPTFKLIYYYCLQSLFTFVYIGLLSSMGERMASEIRKDLFAAILRQDMAFFDAHRTGELVNRLTTDVQDFKSSFKMCISQGLRSVAQTVGCVCSLYLLSPKMTLVMAVGLPLIISLGTLLGSGLRKLSQITAAQIERATTIADEAIGNIRTVRAFAMEYKETELYEKEVNKAAKFSEQLGIGIGAFHGLTNLALNGIVLGVLCMGSYMMTTENLTAGQLMSFLVATQTIQRSLAQLSLLYGQFIKGISAGGRVFKFINLEPEIPLEGGLKIPYHTLRGDIEFYDVTFSYPTRADQLVLKKFNLKIPAGSVVAVCGPSGGGKSTLAILLERFYDAQNGKITIDGINIRDIDPNWLRGKAIGFINQEPILFATSIMENIRYGRSNATDQEVIEAAKLANAHEFIQGFPNGYKTIVGERGVTVSGGQKQRIAIARALIKNPAIIILDEATSALDAESERQLQETLDKVTKGRTVLVIAHRLSTIQNADIIAVLIGGKIVEMGKHEALKKLGGLYWSLIKQQQTEEEITSV